MMRTKWLRTAAAGSALVLALAACGGDGEPETEGTATATETVTEAAELEGAIETIDTITIEGEGEEVDAPTASGEGGASVDGTLKIGTVLPATGDLGSIGPGMIEAVNLAVEQINEAGGVLGNEVELLREDSGTNEQVANSAVDSLLRQNVDAIIGAASSRISLSVIDKITGANVLQCSPSNTGAAFTTYDDAGFYFRTAPPDGLQAPALAQVITGDGFSNVGIIALNDEYGQGFADALSTALEEAGASVAVDVAYDPAGTEFSADVQQLADANPDAVALIGFPDTGSRILREMISQGIGPADIGVYGADGMQDATLGEQTNPDDITVVEGFKGTAPSSAGSEQFTQAFAEFAPDAPQIFSAHAYDCAIVTALAAAQAATDDPVEIANNMNAVTKEGEQCTTFAECLELIDSDTDIDYEGAAGSLDFTGPGEPGSGTYDVWEFVAQPAGGDETATEDESPQETSSPTETES